MRRTIRRPYRGGLADPSAASFNRLLHDYRRSASKRGHQFTLTEQQFKKLTKGHCYYCGCEPKTPILSKSGREPYYFNGVDRVNNDEGYTPSNSVTCCRWCNSFKSNFDHEVFLKHVVSIFLHQIKKLNFKRRVK